MRTRVTLLVGAMLMAGCGPTMPPSAPSPLADRGMPDFQATTIDGRGLDAQALRGHLAVVTFFSKTCASCSRTLPAIQALALELTSVGFVGIAEDQFELDSRDLVTMYQLKFPIAHDRGRAIGAKYHVGELPITFLADRHGVVRWIGGPDESIEDLRRAIDVLK